MLRYALARTSNAANRLTELALLPIGACFIAIIFGAVLSRFVLHHSMVESVELARLAFVWSMLLAAAVGVHRRVHVAIESLRNLMPRDWQRHLATFVHLLVAGFGALMFVYGTELSAKVWATTFPTLGWSQAWLYVPLAVAGALIVVHGLHNAFPAIEEMRK